MRVFVTGGGAFFGRRIVALLEGRGDEVVAADGDPSRLRDTFIARPA